MTSQCFGSRHCVLDNGILTVKKAVDDSNLIYVHNVLGCLRRVFVKSDYRNEDNMNYQQDWFMRQIETMVKMILKLLLGRDIDDALIDEIKDTNENLYNEIQNLISKGEFCQAEDKLYDALQDNESHAFAIALLFYQTLNTFDDERLSKSNFQRDEILSGIKNICSEYANIDMSLLD